MSISTEIIRLQQAKSDLATSIANKGVTVPAATTIDGYAALIDQIQQGGGTLPYDAEIEWLQTTGTQYINTGITPSSGVGVSTEIIFSESINDFCVLGSIIDATISETYYHKFYQITTASSRWYYGNNTSQSYASSYSNTVGATYLVEYNIDGKMKINGISVVNNLSIASAVTSQTLAIAHRRWNSGSETRYGKFKYKNFKIYDNGVLVRNYIPVRVDTTGYMYDKVSKTLFGNAGTGSFTLGPDVT